jgi:hypothetical protein
VGPPNCATGRQHYWRIRSTGTEAVLGDLDADPVLADAIAYPGVVHRVAAGPARQDELDATVAELIAATRGRPVP